MEMKFTQPNSLPRIALGKLPPERGARGVGGGDQPAPAADYCNRDNGLIDETNKREAPGAHVSSKMDFSRPDAAGAKRLNGNQKGDTPGPAPRHEVFPADGRNSNPIDQFSPAFTKYLRQSY